jgi:murein DD-endopeptidase MepM/ murein hydrolase activator NlpD
MTAPLGVTGWLRAPRAALVLAAALGLAVAGCARSGPPAPVVYGSGGPGETRAADQGGAERAGTDRARQRQARNEAAPRERARTGSRATWQTPPRPPERKRGQDEQAARADRAAAPDEAGRRERRTRRTGTAQAQRAAAEVDWDRTGRAGIHTVRRGESVYGLARRYQVPIRAIIDANDLQPPYTLYVGQEVRIPVPRRHVVERGDTVYGISRAYEVDMSELTRLNDIRPPYEITPGQVLVIPGRGRDAAPTRTAGTAASRESASADTSGSGQRARQPESQDDGEAAGQRAAGPATSRDRAELAGLPDAPAGTPTPPRPPARKADSPAQTQTAERAQAAERARTGEPQPQARTQAASAPQPKAIPQPPARAESSFLWPVRGKVLSSFGPMEGGLHNDGINIAAPAGTPIKAAENGVVAYVGNELRGFGNLLLIKHADGWVTAYAHTQEILVRHGQQVKRGQIVARVGATGSVAQPQLHFEVRKGSKAKDPAKLLGGQQAAR